MRPALGVSSPAIRLKSVLLPAPFGPMIARISPSSRARSTALTATSDPNCLVTARTSSTVIVTGAARPAALRGWPESDARRLRSAFRTSLQCPPGAARPAALRGWPESDARRLRSACRTSLQCPPGAARPAALRGWPESDARRSYRGPRSAAPREVEEPRQAGGREERDADDDDADRDQVMVDEPRAEELRGQREEGGAEHRAERRADAAQQRHDDHLEGHRRAEHLGRVDVGQPVSRRPARDRDGERAADVDAALEPVYVDAGGLREPVVLADRAQAVPELRAAQPERRGGHRGHQAQHHVVEDEVTGAERQRHAGAAAGERDPGQPVPGKRQLLGGLREREGADREVRAAQAERRCAESTRCRLRSAY